MATITNLSRAAAIAAASLFSDLAPPLRAQGPVQLDIQVARDENGIPHIQAPTAAKAFYGLGYIVATDRLFQMEFHRRAMRGTLAEIFPHSSHPKAKDYDIRARTLGFARYAEEAITLIQVSDPADYELLVAYSAGVNQRIGECRASTHWPYMFEEGQLDEQHMADWTPADCVLVWMYQAEGTVNWGEIGFAPPPNQPPDAAGSVLPNGGNACFAALMPSPCNALASAAWFVELMRRRDLAQRGTPPSPAIKASHNIVFHGSETTTGKPMLLAKPQHRVSTPSTHYEFALKGGAYDFRGAGFAGSPGVLHGWNRNLAWSVTGMGGDHSDAYKITFTDGNHTHYYVRNLQGVQVLHQITDVATETVVVKGGTNATVEHARTRWGPVITDLLTLGGQHPANVGYSVRSQIFDDANNGLASLLGSLQLMRAANGAEMIAATRNWRHPGAHMLVALKEDVCSATNGTIGYRGLLAVPLRPTPPPNIPFGSELLNGNLELDDWQGTIAFEDMPAYLGTGDFLSTANNLAIDPAALPQPYVLGQVGATNRSWRLSEVGDQVVQGSAISIATIETLDHDMEDPVIRTLVKLARVMRTAQAGGSSLHGGPPLSADALECLATIEDWGVTNWDMDAIEYPFFSHLLALSKDLLFHQNFPLLQQAYGSRGAHVLQMLRNDAFDNEVTFYYTIDDMFDVPTAQEFEAWMDFILARAENLDKSEFETTTFELLHQWNVKPLMDESLGIAYGGNWIAANQTVLNLRAMHGGTVWSQKGEAYKFIADVETPDNNKALLAPGVSEDPRVTGLYLNQLSRWRNGTMYPATITWGTFTVTENILLSYQ